MTENLIESVDEAVRGHEDQIRKLLVDLIECRSLDCQEESAVLRVKEEMERLQYDEVTIDPMGNIIGRMGNGPHVIAFDGHLDVVDVGDASQWTVPAFVATEKEGRIYGRGSADQKAGVAAMVHAAAVMKELELLEDVTILVTGSVNEEDCDGMCWQYLIDEVGLRPEFAVLTEPSDGNIYRGQKGRMCIEIRTRGISAHGSVPERGENAIYKMAPIISEIEELNDRLAYHKELGSGTITISQIFFSSASSCAVADGCRIVIDRRLTLGESKESVLGELDSLKSVRDAEAEVTLVTYEVPTYTGLVYPTESYFLSWITPEDSPVITSVASAFRDLFGKEPVIDKWVFSTNGVAISGLHGIPCVGFGPGEATQAHKADESVLLQEVYEASRLYSLIPVYYRAGMA